MREWMRILFQRDGFEVSVADDGLAARDLIGREYVDVVLTDIRMPRMDGLELLKSAATIAPDAVVCMMTAHFTRDSEEWRRAREGGASALFEKPFRDVNLVTLQVRQLIDARRVRHERDVLRQAIASQGFAGIVGRSGPMLDVFRLVETVCRTNSTILITRRIRHRQGAGRPRHPHRSRCAAITRSSPSTAARCPRRCSNRSSSATCAARSPAPTANKKGLIEVADKGTIFLDEIGEMSPTMQVKLLRVLQERKYRRVGGTEEVAANIRVIAATNRDLATMVGDGKFREDLFYRLNVIPIRLPALRERLDDVPLIAEHFLSKYTREMGKPIAGFSAGAARAAEELSVARQRARARKRRRARRGARDRRAHPAGYAGRRPAGRAAGHPAASVESATRRPTRRCRRRGSIWSTTCRTSSGRTSSARSGRQRACRCGPPNCWA